jgi:hypothetical protein
MAALIDQQKFEQLQKGSVLKAKSEIIYTVALANCGGPGKYPTHMMNVTSPHSQNEDTCEIFHDGEHIRYLDPNDKELDNCIVGDLEQ